MQDDRTPPEHLSPPRLCHVSPLLKSGEGLGVRFFSVALLVLLSLTACARGKPEAPTQQAKADYTYTKEYGAWRIQKEMKKNDIVGLSIALVDDQTVVWAEGFGFADKEKGVKATPETLYRAGSVSKLFTAMAMMQLYEQGKINIDQPLSVALPEFSVKSRFKDAPPITPRMLMTHHSGLFSDYFRGMMTESPEPISSLVKLVKDEYVAYPPNTVLSYSNTGVSLLGCAIEAITQRPFSEYIQEALLSPLGMKTATFEVGPPKETQAYQKGKLKKEYSLRDIPAGGLNASVLDLSRMMMMVFARGQSNGTQIIKPETLSEMLTAQNKDVALDTEQVGLAWFLSGIEVEGATRIAFHDGATLFHRALFLALPEQGLGVILLSNSQESGTVEVKLASEILELAILAKAGKVPPKKKKDSQKETLSPKPSGKDLSGEYASLAGLLQIEKKLRGYKTKLGKQKLALIPKDDGAFNVKLKLFRLIPIPLNVSLSLEEAGGREVLIARQGPQQQLLGERITSAQVPAAWQARVGEYQIKDPGKDFLFVSSLSIRYEDGRLLAVLGSKGAPGSAFPLEAASDTEAIVLGLGRSLGVTIEARDNNLKYVGYLWEPVPSKKKK